MAPVVNTRLNRLQVMGLEATDRAQLLTARWLFYKQCQDDHCVEDWEGYGRESGQAFLEWRQRGLVRAKNSTVPWGNKRPICHATLVGETVDTYSALLLGEGREPSIRVVGDDESSMAITALFVHAGFWAVLSEARKYSGAMGCAAVLPEVIKGRMSLRTLRPEHIYAEWTTDAAYVPSLVIEQKQVTIERIGKDGRVETLPVWRTRAWDETHSYAYLDLAVDGEKDPDAERDGGARPIYAELDGPPVEHHAGRCPIIWIQNTLNSDGPVGEADCEDVFEQVSQLDKSLSMVVRGSRANNDPTLLIKDTRAALSQWPKREKGYGKSLTVSEKGDASLLETSGAAVSQSWTTIREVESRVRARTGVVSPTPDNAGAYQSGVALQILHRTQNSRAGTLRKTLGDGIRQLVQVVHAQLSELGIKDVVARRTETPTKGIEMPQREFKEAAEPDDDRVMVAKMEPHTIGPGGAVVLNWPSLHEPIPSELVATADALLKLNGGQPVLSQETTVAQAVTMAQTDTDQATELERIKRERAEKVEGFDEVMMPDVEDGEPEEDTGEGEPNAAPTDDVAKDALNGIQIKEMGNTLVRAGEDLAPEAAAFVLTEGFPTTDAAAIDAAIKAQMKFSADKPKPEPIPGATPFEAAPGKAAPPEPEEPDDDDDDDLEEEDEP